MHTKKAKMDSSNAGGLNTENAGTQEKPDVSLDLSGFYPPVRPFRSLPRLLFRGAGRSRQAAGMPFLVPAVYIDGITLQVPYFILQLYTEG